MANIPSHMRLADELGMHYEVRRGSTWTLVVTGVAIGFIAAALALLGGLIH
jgi:hypothetical protein